MKNVGSVYEGGGLVVELKITYILKTMKNKFEANIAQSKMQSEKMLKTMQQLSADAVYAAPSKCLWMKLTLKLKL